MFQLQLLCAVVHKLDKRSLSLRAPSMVLLWRWASLHVCSALVVWARENHSAREVNMQEYVKNSPYLQKLLNPARQKAIKV